MIGYDNGLTSQKTLFNSILPDVKLFCLFVLCTYTYTIYAGSIVYFKCGDLTKDWGSFNLWLTKCFVVEYLTLYVYFVF